MSPRPKIQTPRLPFDEAPPATGADLPDAADRAASVDPTQNVVLEASAGTGKTRVLVDRYSNLLAAGVDPRNILAITFTRKAAAEMRERIITSLRRSAEIGAIPQARWREIADRLGDIAISTIDAFCLSLLREFPLEADLDPGFEMADETEVLRFVDDALDATLGAGRALAREDPAVGLVYAQLGDARLREGLAVLLERRLVAREGLRRFLVQGPADLTPSDVCRDAVNRVAQTLGSVEGGLVRFLADGPRHHPRFAILAAEVRRLVLDPPADAAIADAVRVQRIRSLVDQLEDHFFTRAGQPRSRWSYNAGDCDSPEAWRRHRERAVRIAPRLADDLARFRRDLNVVLSRGVSRLFAVALDQYRRTLTAHAVVDFPDALWRTLALLEQMDEFAQSRYLLEARYHHLLVDEFQDTSQAQWELVWRLVQAWSAGLGVGQDLPLQPSIFIVGDRKQSIYGFRDADAAVLARAAREIAGIRQDRDVRRSIRKSFRAVPGLLAFTNDLFTALPKVEGREDAFEYGDRDRFPIDTVDAWQGDPVVGLIVDEDPGVCAGRVASEIARLLGTVSVRDKQTGVARVARPGDVGILFRSREGHQAYEEALEARGIPSYVYKGLGFFDADEIKDVVALLRYFADPASDLRAAALLRSRFVRLSDGGLQALAPRLAEALRLPVAAEGDLDDEDRAVLGQARAAVNGWLRLVDRVPPADLLDTVMDESAYAFELAGARVGQTRENLKKVRSLVRRIQNRGYATMARIAEHLDRLSAGDESNAVVDALDAVNLMTVHAAKGLEFPIVFLVNIGKGSGGSRPAIRLTAEAGAGTASVSVGDYRSDADDDATEREREETKRLLYVAITRARDRVYLAATTGHATFRPARGSLAEVLPPSLLDTIAAAGEADLPSVTWSGASGTHGIVVCRDESLPVLPRLEQPAFQSASAPSDFGPIADPTPRPRRAATSLESGARPVPADGADSSRLAGTLVHRLFEQFEAARLDDDEALDRRLALLLRPSERVTLDDVEPVVVAARVAFRQMAARASVVALLTGPDRWHEVPFTLALPDALVEGTIDCLVREAGGLVVVELKTGRPSPAHRAQLATYLEAARHLVPGERVRGVLVYPDRDVWDGSPAGSAG
jgi:ATP-dependent helicase/nuclease subunit A